MQPVKQHFTSAIELPREHWDKKSEFLLSIIGFSVDLGNVWRFPSIVYQNGGGVFFIPYFCMLIVVGFPLFYMEIAIGQYYNHGCFTVWQFICPIVKGIGPATLLINLMMGMYYNTIISWAVRYFVASFNRELPWKTCEHKWNSPCCVALQNQSIPNNCSSTILSTEEYFRNVIQGISEAHGFSNLGNIRWQLILCLTFVFVLTYFALWKGVKSAGKFVWVTATAPYVMMIILLCKGLTLDGAYLGIKYYFQIDIRRLYSYKIWNDAATQMCFSLGPGFGTLLALSSYNNKNNNCYRDAIITSSINCATSVIAGLVVFCTLGHMAKISNTNVSNVIKDKGSELIFIVYPHVVSLMKYPVMWSLMFFFLLVTLGLDSTFAGLESVITGLCDQFPIYLVARRKWLVGVVIAICFIGGLPTCTNGGPYVIDLMNEIAISPGILFVLVTECLAISWNYGTRRLGKIMLEMTGTYPNVVLRILWTVVAPSVLILITACQIKSLKNNEVSIRGVKINELPPLAKTATLFMIIIPASMIPIWAIIALFRANGKSIEEKLEQCLIPIASTINEDYSP